MESIKDLNKSVETSPNKALFFEKLNAQETQELKERIKEHDGLIRVFIHTLRVPDQPGETKYQDREYPALMKILSSEKTPPVFFLEDTRDMKDIKRVMSFVQENNVLKKPVYIVETLERLPFPVVENEERPIPPQGPEGKKLTSEEVDYRSKSMLLFIFKLHLLGVKKILVGGNNLEVDGEYIRQCVGLFIDDINLLKELDIPDGPKIDIKVSMLAAPHNRNDLKGIRDDLVFNS